MTNRNHLENFSLSWRFTDENYNQLSEIDLLTIQANDKDASLTKWNNGISSEYSHITSIDIDQLGNRVHSFRIDWDDEVLGLASLTKYIPIKDDEIISFFWSSTCSVSTPWKTVKKYWVDFFYPDDDNTVVISEKYIIVYSSESFIVYEI